MTLAPAVPGPTATAVELLADYPHVARCAACRSYTEAALVGHRARLVQTSTLAFHDAAHRGDPLLTASQHFAPDDAATLA